MKLGLKAMSKLAPGELKSVPQCHFVLTTKLPSLRAGQGIGEATCRVFTDAVSVIVCDIDSARATAGCRTAGRRPRGGLRYH
jgi:hypothetical protein